MTGRNLIIVVSIHAPAKGATNLKRDAIRGVISFNPRSREGSDHLLDADEDGLSLFQSTLP